MSTPHKHRDVIIAWANGEQIQWKDEFVRNWTDWVAEYAPPFGSRTEYRIKPKTEIKFMALVQGITGPCPSNLCSTYQQVVSLFRGQGKPFTVYQVTLENGKIVSCEEVMEWV